MSFGGRRALTAAGLAAAFLTTLPAQEAPDSRPAPFPPAAAEPMRRLRDGRGSIEDLRAAVAAEVAAGRLDSAAWWIAGAEADLAPPKASASARAATAELKREAARRRAPSTEDRALVAKLVRRVEAAVLQKNFDEARRVAATAATLLLFIDDAEAARNAAALDVRLKSAPKGDADPRELEKGRAAFLPTEDAARAAFVARFASWCDQYRAAGCRSGRLLIEKAMASAMACGFMPADTMRSRTLELRTLARRTERTRRVGLLLRSRGRVRFYLDGEPAPSRRGPATADATTDEIDFDLLPGDRLQAAFDTSARNGGPGEPPMFLVALHATLDGAAAPAEAWKLNVDGDPKNVDPRLRAGPLCKKRKRVAADSETSDPEFNADVKGADLVLDVPTPDGAQFNIAAFSGDLPLLETIFIEKRLPISWYGTAIASFVLVFEVPDVAR
jgi:hypothetical protein